MESNEIIGIFFYILRFSSFKGIYCGALNAAYSIQSMLKIRLLCNYNDHLEMMKW
jgi:hypothetical protein